MPKTKRTQAGFPEGLGLLIQLLSAGVFTISRTVCGSPVKPRSTRSRNTEESVLLVHQRPRITYADLVAGPRIVFKCAFLAEFLAEART